MYMYAGYVYVYGWHTYKFNVWIFSVWIPLETSSELAKRQRLFLPPAPYQTLSNTTHIHTARIGL